MDEYPHALDELISFFENLAEGERRDNLIAFAESAVTHVPKAGEIFDLEDIRHDEECTDTVGVYARLDKDRHVEFAIVLGPKVQTLTKAMVTILCRGLNGSTIDEILVVSRSFIPRIVGAELVRLRSQTVYYMLDRIKQAAENLAQIRNKAT